MLSVVCKKLKTFSHEKSGLWVGDFKYAISIFKGTKGVAMADFSSVKAMETMFACMVGFSMSENSNMLIKILGEQRELP